MKTSRFVLAGLTIALVLAGGLVLYASSEPDGLESAMLEGCRTGADGEISGGTCVAQQEADHEIGGPLADYGMSFLDNDTLGGSLSGIAGVALVLAVAWGLFTLLARKRGTGGEGE
ncbi:PDGLE domain-containing protein [Glycomyces xiaoerkulensis]|uniref:PDGLE domain-containing protein n=1 Tax=Glycomyces xiaoerkulensis TaxID=2038139 RepID=UPI000C268996|nr:PDGLE domain-containing protein [Glycomyces xiaoerkulensis]